jgi:type III restriction enzyme
MSNGNPFFDHPVLNSPYSCPGRHWELDDQGQPPQKTIEHRRPAEFITPIPKPKKLRGKQKFANETGLSISVSLGKP